MKALTRFILLLIPCLFFALFTANSQVNDLNGFRGSVGINYTALAPAGVKVTPSFRPSFQLSYGFRMLQNLTLTTGIEYCEPMSKSTSSDKYRAEYFRFMLGPVVKVFSDLNFSARYAHNSIKSQNMASSLTGKHWTKSKLFESQNEVVLGAGFRVYELIWVELEKNFTIGSGRYQYIQLSLTLNLSYINSFHRNSKKH